MTMTVKTTPTAEAATGDDSNAAAATADDDNEDNAIQLTQDFTDFISPKALFLLYGCTHFFRIFCIAS